MKQIALALFLATFATQVSAQTTQPDVPDGEVEEGVDLLNEGARLLFRGLLNEVEPAMRDLARQLQDLNWNGIKIEDLDDYQAPEVLPNGDIILRRKPPVVTPPGPGETDL